MGNLGCVTWKPMTFGEARKVLSEDPPRIETTTNWLIRKLGTPRGAGVGLSARYVEAWMVRSGAAPERTKAVMERLLGGRLD